MGGRGCDRHRARVPIWHCRTGTTALPWRSMQQRGWRAARQWCYELIVVGPWYCGYDWHNINIWGHYKVRVSGWPSKNDHFERWRSVFHLKICLTRSNRYSKTSKNCCLWADPRNSFTLGRNFSHATSTTFQLLPTWRNPLQRKNYKFW